MNAATFSAPSAICPTYAFAAERTARIARVLWAREQVASLIAAERAAWDEVNPWTRIAALRDIKEELRAARSELLSAEISIRPGDHAYLN